MELCCALVDMTLRSFPHSQHTHTHHPPTPKIHALTQAHHPLPFLSLGHQAVMHYGEALKLLTNEKFGDGIMSASESQGVGAGCCPATRPRGCKA